MIARDNKNFFSGCRKPFKTRRKRMMIYRLAVLCKVARNDDKIRRFFYKRNKCSTKYLAALVPHLAVKRNFMSKGCILFTAEAFIKIVDVRHDKKLCRRVCSCRYRLCIRIFCTAGHTVHDTGNKEKT